MKTLHSKMAKQNMNKESYTYDNVVLEGLDTIHREPSKPNVTPFWTSYH